MPTPAPPNTVRDLVRQLGGPTSLAKQFGVSVEAVCNWQARNAVPASRAIAMWRLAQNAGLAWRPPGAAGLVQLEVTPAQSDEVA